MKGLHWQANLCCDLLNKGISKPVLFICLLFGVTITVSGQTAKIQRPITSLSSPEYDIQPLTIGDKVPDITFHNILNYKSKTAKLSDFRGKLVILDMWSVYCTSCIAAFPKMEELQKEFGDRIQMLLVNPHDAKYDSEEKIIATLNKLKTRTGYYPSLPIPIHDSLLNKYFPHLSVPHQIWIDGRGKIVAITESKYATKENILSIIEGREINIPLKNDWAFDEEKPLLVEGNGGGSDDFIFRSIFTGYKEGFGASSGTRWNQNGDIVGIYMLNKPLWYLIGMAYSETMRNIGSNRTIINIRNNPERVSKTSNSLYKYCYDLVIPPTAPRFFDQNKYLREDIKRYFKIIVKREPRKMRCLIITVPGKLLLPEAKMPKSIDLDDDSKKKHIHNYSINRIISLLDGYFPIPLIDETGMSEVTVDIDFPENFELANTKSMLKFLRDIGFELHEEEREIEVIVFSDINE